MDIKYGTNMDVKSEAFLKAIHEAGGDATTSEIRDRTGLSDKERNYRFKKLENMQFIEVRKAQSGYGKRRPPKVADLTDMGVAYVEDNGISEEAEDWLLENEVTERMDELETRIQMLESMTTQSHERLSSLELFRQRVARLMFGTDRQ